MYVYIRSEPGLWTVGFYKPDGKWEPESDHSDREEAAKRAAWLNGSQSQAAIKSTCPACGGRGGWYDPDNGQYVSCSCRGKEESCS